MNTFDNPLESESNTEVKYVVRYKLNDRGEKIYEPNERVYEENKLRKVMEPKDNKMNCFDIFEHTEHPLDNTDDDYYLRELVTYNP